VKILHLNTESAWRGGERQTLYLLTGLKERGIEAHLVCQPDSPLAERAQSADLAVWPIAMRGEADVTASLTLRRLVKRFGCDLVHSHTSHAHTLAYWATAGLPIVRLVTRRVEYSIYRNSFFGLNRIKYRRMADAYIAISERIRQVLISDGVPAEMIRVAYSGVALEPDSGGADEIMAEFDIGKGTPILLSVAHLSPEKGHAILLQAMRVVIDRIPSVRLMVVGDGICRTSLEALVDKLGLGHAVSFAGFRDNVAAFYGLADLFVSSSTAEGLGSSILDALAAGVPVVATAVGGIPEIIENGQTGVLVPAAEPQALAQGVIDQLGQPDKANAMAARGKEVVRARFSVDRMIDDTVAIYQELLPQPSYTQNRDAKL
jgi:glycosyltransferase involved in cell wall biosynthesis